MRWEESGGVGKKRGIPPSEILHTPLGVIRLLNQTMQRNA